MKHRNISIGTNQIQVAESGTGMPLLLVHGFPLDHTMWRFQIDGLSDRYRVICPDLPGFGTSRGDTEAMSMKKFADQIARLLDGMAIDEPVVFCGLSMGGYIGWQFWKHHSRRVSHLVACDTRAASDSPQVARARKLAAASVRQTGSSPVADAMVEKLFYRPTDPDNRAHTEQIHAVISQTNPESIAKGQLAMAERSQATSILAKIDVPSLFVVGAHDQITPPEEMRQDAAKVPDASLIVLPDAGHMAPLENPHAFNHGLIEFLERTENGNS